MKTSIVLLAVLLGAGVCVGVKQAAPQQSAKPRPAMSVSVIQLIANPNQYDDKRVWFIGYARFVFEDTKVYLHSDDDYYNIQRNGIYIHIPAHADFGKYHAFDREYVLIEGTFEADSVSLRDVTRLQSQGKPETSDAPK